ERARLPREMLVQHGGAQQAMPEIRDEDEVVVVKVERHVAPDTGEVGALRLEQAIAVLAIDEPRLDERIGGERRHGDVPGERQRGTVGETVNLADEAGQMQRDDTCAAD